jgi:hypothetical protein
MIKLKGKIRIEFHDIYGNQTQELVEETNLIFNQTYLDILGVKPNALFREAYILISSTSTPPNFNDTAITNILASGSVPGGVISPIWYESVTPNFGEIQNQIAAPATARTFYTVGLARPFGIGRKDLTATLLTISCTQNAFEILTIYYRIEVFNSRGERLSPRFTRDFGGAIFGRKECFHGMLGASYCNAPTKIYIDPLQDSGIIDTRFPEQRWGEASIISSHYKYKENRTFKIAQSGIPGDTDEFIGVIFNSLLTGTSNVILPNNTFIAGNYTENTFSAYRISSYKAATINIDPTKPVFQPPFQKIWSHRVNAPLPFFDPNNAAAGTAYPSIAGTWAGKWPELYRYTITFAGAMGVSQYRFSKRLHLGFNGNAYSDRTVICPFRNPNTPSSVGMHGWRIEDNDLLRFSDTQIVQYDNTGVTLLDLMDGNHTIWDATTTPILNVTKLRQCAVDTTNKLIYCACRDTGLWIIDVINGTTAQLPTPCYGVDVGRNNVAFAIFEGFLRNSTNWNTDLTFVYTGLTNNFWSRAFFLKADPSNANDAIAIAIDSPSTPGSSRRVVWYNATTTLATTGYDSANVKQWAASMDVSDTGGFWAIASNKLIFGSAGISAIASPPVQNLTHSVWGNVNLYKISFYDDSFISGSAIINSSNVSQNAYTSLGTTATVLHLQGGIVVLSNALRQLFTDNIYAWENYGWDGSSWVLNNTNSKPTHTSSDLLIQGLVIQWNAGTFQLGDFFTQGILNGTWKDNATTVFIENFWYTKAVHFDVALPTGLTVPAIAPYEIVFPAASNPVFLRIETDSVNILNKFTLNGIAVPTIYVNGEMPGAGELTIYPTAPNGKAVFNAADAGKIWAGTYSWIEA